MAGTTYAYSAYLNYSERITADEITVILNGTTYTVPRQEDEGGSWYGSIELYGDGEAECQYPFCIYHESNRNKLLVSYDVYTNHNPVSVEITQESGVTTTPCFDKARGYSCEETVTLLTEETVTTAVDPEYPDEAAFADLVYSQLIDAETIKVTFNGTVYECPRTVLPMGYGYGAPYELDYDWSEYPFNITSDSVFSRTMLATETAGTYTVKIEGMQEVATTTPCFEKAVRSVVSPLVVEATPAPYEATGASPSYLNASGDEIMEAMTTRGAVVRDPYGAVYSVLFVGGGSVTIGNGLYHSTTQQTEFETYAYTEGSDGLRYPPEAHQ